MSSSAGWRKAVVAAVASTSASGFRYARLGALVASAMLALAVMTVAQQSASWAAAQCSGVQVHPGADLAKVATSHLPGTTYCIYDGSYSVSHNIEVEAGDKWIGVYSDGTRPIVKSDGVISWGAGGVTVTGTGVDHVFQTDGASNVLFEGLDVSGAVHSDACEPDCGRGIGGGGDNVTVRDVYAHHNENQGVGGMGSGLLIEDSVLKFNGSHDAARDDIDGDEDVKVSAAGVKTTSSFTIRNSDTSDNYWTGVWCDGDCDQMVVENIKSNNNGKAGISYEISDGPASKITASEIKNNGNGRPEWQADYGSRFAGVLIVDSKNITVSGNTLGGNATASGSVGILVADDHNRKFRVRRVSIGTNTGNGDAVKGCTLRRVLCY